MPKELRLKEIRKSDTVRYFYQKLHIDVYDFTIHVFFCFEKVLPVRNLPKIIKLIGEKYPDECEVAAFHEYHGGRTSFLFLRYNADYCTSSTGTIVHECFHASTQILKYIGGSAAVLADEPHAYLLDCIVEKVDEMAVYIHNNFSKNKSEKKS